MRWRWKTWRLMIEGIVTEGYHLVIFREGEIMIMLYCVIRGCMSK